MASRRVAESLAQMMCEISQQTYIVHVSCGMCAAVLLPASRHRDGLVQNM